MKTSVKFEMWMWLRGVPLEWMADWIWHFANDTPTGLLNSIREAEMPQKPRRDWMRLMRASGLGVRMSVGKLIKRQDMLEKMKGLRARFIIRRNIDIKGFGFYKGV